MFDADVFILHRLGLTGGFHQKCAEFAGVVDLLRLGPGDAGPFGQRLIHLILEEAAVDAELFQNGGNQTVLLAHQCGEDVDISQFGIGILDGEIVGSHQGFPAFRGKFFHIHNLTLLLMVDSYRFDRLQARDVPVLLPAGKGRQREPFPENSGF